MSGTLKNLLEIVREKKQYKIGQIISVSNAMNIVRDSSGGQLQVSGNGYTKGQHVLIENNKIIAVINSKMNKNWVN